jgi:putative spermidine/putrescine transport system ATP-binding protein
MTTVAAHGLALRRITKRYGSVPAMEGIELDVAPGEFLTLLGPSGSGKTTVLMTIAGFIEPDEGEILLDGRAITGIPAEARNFGVVFQGYALFPHMTVAENVAYPLRVRKVERRKREERVKTALRLVQLEALAERMPRQLWGASNSASRSPARSSSTRACCCSTSL